MQQPGQIFRELCHVKKASPRSSTVYESVYVTSLNDQILETANGLVVARGHEWGWGVRVMELVWGDGYLQNGNRSILMLAELFCILTGGGYENLPR